MGWIRVVWLLPFLCGCEDYHLCEPPPAAVVELPERLSDTGLFADVATETLGPGVVAYAPQFELWSDGADKRRWIALPPGERIDTTDMDFWLFPAGTRIWKEFTRDGVRVETRLMQKVGPEDGDWSFLAYLWNEDGADAVARPAGVIDARGTLHDVPAATECIGCHGGMEGRVLGVSAIQLSFAAAPGALDLTTLTAADQLTVAPPGDFSVPGDDTVRGALGYLHANCGHCHNARRPARSGPRCFDPESTVDFWLRVDRLGTPEETPTYVTAIGSAVARGKPGDSDLIDRVSTRAFFVGMPPLGTDAVDRDSVALLTAWVQGL